jgi:hypothetical protein
MVSRNLIPIDNWNLTWQMLGMIKAADDHMLTFREFESKNAKQKNEIRKEKSYSNSGRQCLNPTSPLPVQIGTMCIFFSYPVSAADSFTRPTSFTKTAASYWSNRPMPAGIAFARPRKSRGTETLASTKTQSPAPPVPYRASAMAALRLRAESLGFLSVRSYEDVSHPINASSILYHLPHSPPRNPKHRYRCFGAPPTAQSPLSSVFGLIST